MTCRVARDTRIQWIGCDVGNFLGERAVYLPLVTLLSIVDELEKKAVAGSRSELSKDRF